MSPVAQVALKAMVQADAQRRPIHEAAQAVVPEGSMEDLVVELTDEKCLPEKCVSRNGQGKVQMAWAFELTDHGRAVGRRL
jgi:hypothetical protein